MTKINVIRSLVLLSFLSVSLGACSRNMDEVFDKSATERVQEELSAFDRQLQSATNGWVMEYYPGGINQDHGGIPLTISFNKDGFATFRNGTDVTKAARSLYSIRKDMGITLSFDTYNNIFHQYSDPDMSAGQGRGKGLEGDFEFVLESRSIDEIILSGKKHNAIIRMYPLKKTATEYLKQANAQAAAYSEIPGIVGLKGSINGKEITGSLLSQRKFRLQVGEESAEVPFMFTDTGVKLYQPFTLAGTTVTAMTFDAETSQFKSSEGNLTLSLIRNPLGLKLEDLLGKYQFSFSKNTAEVELVLEDGVVVMKGLSNQFSLVFKYNLGLGVLEWNPHSIAPNAMAAGWASRSSQGSLSWNSSVGMYSVWNGDMANFELTFESNSYLWVSGSERLYCDAIIFWTTDGKGEFKDYGLSRFTNMKLTKVQ